MQGQQYPQQGQQYSQQGQQYSQHGQHYAPQGPAFNTMPNGGDAFMTGLATDVLQQQSATYIQRGQAFMQQRMGFLSTDVMHYFFNLNSEYGETHCNALEHAARLRASWVMQVS